MWQEQQYSRPFYQAYPHKEFYESERIQEREMEQIKACYPKSAQLIQDRVDRECDMLEYEGSLMFDEYPDRLQVELLAKRIARQVNGEEEMQVMELSPRYMNDLISVLLYQEMCRRRCRRCRCRRFF